MLDEGVARVVTGSLHGLTGLRVRVEVDLARGLPGFSMVGLPGTAVRESRERVGAALRHAGFQWPQARITVNLAPADLRKDGAAIDLALATGLLLASGQVQRPADGLLRRTLIVGELGLDGALRPARGALALGLDAAILGADRMLVPTAQGRELESVPGLRRVELSHLRELPEALERLAAAMPSTGPSAMPAPVPPTPVEWGEVKGQERAKRALAIAAAGGHHLLLCGPPGCGKSMLARCLPTLLPPLPPAEQLERLRIHSCAGLPVDLALAAIPPLRSPHPTVSRAGLIGGGRPPRPGEVTLAHLGVLLLDEAAEFGQDKLDLLREPLTAGEIVLSRLGESVVFPARFQLLATTNPCACGWFGSEARPCRCLDSDVARYRRRLSGPLRDRIDLWVDTDREPAHRYWDCVADPTPLRLEVAAARERALARGSANAHLEGERLHRACALTSRARSLAQRAADGMGLSVRAVASALRVARTIGDLAARERVDEPELAEALQFRRP